MQKNTVIFSGLLFLTATSLMAKNCTSSMQYLPKGEVIQTWNPVTINQLLNQYQPGTLPPFDRDCSVIESIPTQAAYLVRFYSSNSGSPIGSYLVNPTLIRHMTSEQIRNVLALPTRPDKWVYVKIPAGNQYGLWTGIAAPISGWGEGGAVQTKVIGFQTDPSSFEDYTYLPTNSFMNDQFIGQEALSYTPSARIGNAGKVANYLDAHLPDPSTGMENIYTTLDFINAESSTQLATALRQISPVNFDSYSAIELRNDLLFKSLLLNHTESEPPSSKKKNHTNLPNPCLTYWNNIGGEAGLFNPASDGANFNYQTGAITSGITCQPQPRIQMGVGIGYLHNNIDWKSNNLGNATLDNLKIGAFSSYLAPSYFFTALLTTGYNWGSAIRNINFTGNGIAVLSGLVVDTLTIEQVANSHQTGQNVGVHFLTGKNLPLHNVNIAPLAQISYFYSRQNSFKENGSDTLSLNVNAFSAQTLHSQLTLLLQRTFMTTSGYPMQADLGLGWANYLPLDTRQITATLPCLGGQFGANGYNKGLTTALLNANLETSITKQLSVAGQYKAEIGKGFTSQLVMLRLNYYMDASL